MLLSSINFVQSNIVSHPNNQATHKSFFWGQSSCDEVSFGAITANHPMLHKALVKQDYLDKFVITSLSPVAVFHIPSKSKVKVYLATIKGTYGGKKAEKKWGNKANAMAVFSENGKLLGDLKYFAPEESKHLGKYLRLRELNTSYTDDYKGLGSIIIDKAKQISNNLGCCGQLKVNALNIFAPERGSPVPFYTRMGFIAVKDMDKTYEQLLKECNQREQNELYTSMYLLTNGNLAKLQGNLNTKRK